MKLNFKVNKSADFVLDYLTDMQKFASVHPVISKIKPTGSNKYLVYETLPLGFIPISFTYPVVVNSNSASKTVFFNATVLTFMKIDMAFIIKPDDEFSEIEETIVFSSPLPGKFIMERIFKKQHTQLFRNIDLV
jgi:carbon monoxide dehydrogenase subunit G